MTEKRFDLVLYGATGFVGRQAVAYLRKHAPEGLRWAIAGRDATKLQALGAGVPILIANTGDRTGLEELVGSTRVLASTAGPFRLHSDPLVEACVRIGTHYLDISGETARIRDLIDRHHEKAKAARVRIVNFCAASSAPADLGVWLLDAALGGRLIEAKGYYEIGGGSFNGGTIASIGLALESGDARREADPFLLGPVSARKPTPLEKDPKGVRFDRDIQAWTTLSPMGTSDTRAVRRSSALKGRDIVYQEYSAFPSGWGAAAGFSTIYGLFSLAMRIGFVRRALARKMPPGTGPSEAEMDAGWFKLRLLGTSGQQRAEVTVRGQGDVGNRVTTMCLCQSALALSVDEDKLPQVYGVLTPSIAFGQVLVDRLTAAKMEFSTRRP